MSFLWPSDHLQVVLVLPVGLLHRGCHHCEWCRGGTCEESHLCSLRLLHGVLHLPGDCGLDLGRWLVGHHLGCGLHGLCGQRILGQILAIQIHMVHHKSINSAFVNIWRRIKTSKNTQDLPCSCIIYSLRHSAGPLAYCRFAGCRRLF